MEYVVSHLHHQSSVSVKILMLHYYLHMTICEIVLFYSQDCGTD